MRTDFPQIHKQFGYAVEVNLSEAHLNARRCQGLSTISTLLIVAVSLLGCDTTSTPTPPSKEHARGNVDGSVAMNRAVQPVETSNAKNDTTLSEKPWDAPVAAGHSSAFQTPNIQQWKELLKDAAWVRLEENGTLRRSLQLKGDGSFGATAVGLNGELPAFAGLKAHAQGSWTVRGSELLLHADPGVEVVIQLQWLGDKRIMLLNGESWIRSP